MEPRILALKAQVEYNVMERTAAVRQNQGRFLQKSRGRVQVLKYLMQKGQV
jgi:hypothetical protein